MSHGKTIAFNDDAKDIVPFIQENQADDQKIIENCEKLNYMTISSMEGGNMASNYSTVTSCSSYYPRDTAILLHDKHKKYEEDQQREIRMRSLKGTICFVFTIVILLALVGLAIASLYNKLKSNDTTQHNMDSNGFNNTNSSFVDVHISRIPTLLQVLNKTSTE